MFDSVKIQFFFAGLQIVCRFVANKQTMDNLMEQVGQLEQATHNIGRSEAIRDAMTLVGAHIDTVENKIMARWDELNELRKQGEIIYAEDDKLMHGLNDQRRVLYAIHKELVNL
jgi:hypothetical protein